MLNPKLAKSQVQLAENFGKCVCVTWEQNTWGNLQKVCFFLDRLSYFFYSWKHFMNKNTIALIQEILNIFDKWTYEIFLQRYRLLYNGDFKPAVNLMVVSYFFHRLILTTNGYWWWKY